MTDDEPDLEPLAVPAPWAVNPAQTPAAADVPQRGPSTSALVALVVTMLVAGLVGFAVASRLQSDTPFEAAVRTPSTTPRTPTTPSTPALPVDPDAGVLRALGVQQQDVGASYTVNLLIGGDQVVGETTLDLCNGTFPSEALRSARFQVYEAGPSNDVVMSTESVLYKNPTSADQAFAELRRVRADCPHIPVPTKSRNGSTVTTTFQPAPDSSWGVTPSVDRLAYEFDTVDLAGARDHSIAVYLHRGRVLMGLYFAQPTGVQPAVGGKTTVKAITKLFEARVGALPLAVVNRHV